MLNRIVNRPRSALREFLKTEAAGGIVLMLAAALALFAANSALRTDYFALTGLVTGPVLAPKLGPMTVQLWVNDGLMAVFFMLVGLEIKREFADGHLSSWADRRLPMVAATGGMIVPALIYVTIAGNTQGLLRGWAIPAATDIAFAIGVLALLGSRAPASLKLFLTTVAIIDDMGAVTIIALFYTESLSFGALGVAVMLWVAKLVLNRRGVSALWPYLILSGLLWYATLLSGIHATIAGVLAAFAIPYRRSIAMPDAESSPLHRLQHALHKPVAFFIVPLFGFANAGVTVVGLTADQIFGTLPLAIAAGLFVGKQVGIFGFVWTAVKLGFAVRPREASWRQIYGVSALCGIGFTMSLFIGGLAFYNPALSDGVKIGVLMGSIASALLGYVLLRTAPTSSGRNDSN
jgi:Na+:H+ antiporter, NhaA family